MTTLLYSGAAVSPDSEPTRAVPGPWNWKSSHILLFTPALALCWVMIISTTVGQWDNCRFLMRLPFLKLFVLCLPVYLLGKKIDFFCYRNLTAWSLQLPRLKWTEEAHRLIEWSKKRENTWDWHQTSSNTADLLLRDRYVSRERLKFGITSWAVLKFMFRKYPQKWRDNTGNRQNLWWLLHV